MAHGEDIAPKVECKISLTPDIRPGADIQAFRDAPLF
jgi:hypothetical protein